jgi:DNA-binding MarR family transcriptional regulator
LAEQTPRPELEHLEQVIKQVFRRISSEWNKQCGPALTSSQAHILELLENGGSQKVSDIAEALDITLSAVTGLADRLLTAGYIKRDRSELDRRIVLLKVTELGSKALIDVLNQRRAILRKYYGGLREEDIQHLVRIYRLILQNEDLTKKE